MPELSQSEIEKYAQQFIEDLIALTPEVAEEIKPNRDLIFRFLMMGGFVPLGIRRVKKLPDSIGNLINLKYIDLNNNNNNKLTLLPDSIGNLINLAKINLSYNQLTLLPDSIGNLINLTKINLSYNQLTHLPDSIGNLVKLTHLELTNKEKRSA